MTAREALLRALAGPPWMEHAACWQTHPDLFFHKRGETLAEAKAVCAGCPVRERCLEYANDLGIKHGLWGGLSERERRRMRARRTTGHNTNPDTKWCPDCQEQRPRDEFATNTKAGDGLQNYCKQHANQRRKAARAAQRGAA